MMAHEFTCPACHARLSPTHHNGEAFVHCPSCLETVARPEGAAGLPRRGGSVPSVEAETRHSRWWGYFIALAITLVFGLGVILITKAADKMPGVDWLFMVLIPAAFLCDLALTFLILFPAAYALVRGVWPAPGSTSPLGSLRKVAVILLLVILGPFALYVVFVAVCAASLAALSI